MSVDPADQQNGLVVELSSRTWSLEAIRKLRRESEHDVSIGGAELGGLVLEADLVDECQLFLNPVIVGGRKPAFRAALRRNLELLETRRFGTGVIHVRYRVRGAQTYGVTCEISDSRAPPGS